MTTNPKKIQFKSKKKKEETYKSLSLGLSKELYEALVEKSDSERRSLTAQILYMLEGELLKKKEDDSKR
jgi:hypothetical protein